jgi:hypothetical protein
MEFFGSDLLDIYGNIVIPDNIVVPFALQSDLTNYVLLEDFDSTESLLSTNILTANNTADTANNTANDTITNYIVPIVQPYAYGIIFGAGPQSIPPGENTVVTSAYWGLSPSITTNVGLTYGGGAWQVPIRGIYHVRFSINTAHSGVGVRASFIRLSGSFHTVYGYNIKNAVSSDRTACVSEDVLLINAGESVRSVLYHTAGANLGTNPDLPGSFSIALIRPFPPI